VQADLIYCGPDGETRPPVEQVIADVGLRPIYLGGNEYVELVNMLTLIWGTLAIGQQHGQHLAFKLLTR